MASNMVSFSIKAHFKHFELVFNFEFLHTEGLKLELTFISRDMG